MLKIGQLVHRKAGRNRGFVGVVVGLPSMGSEYDPRAKVAVRWPCKFLDMHGRPRTITTKVLISALEPVTPVTNQ